MNLIFFFLMEIKTERGKGFKTQINGGKRPHNFREFDEGGKN